MVNLSQAEVTSAGIDNSCLVPLDCLLPNNFVPPALYSTTMRVHNEDYARKASCTLR